MYQKTTEADASKQSEIPTLYHGSAHQHDEIKSGFSRSGKRVVWDETESNEYVYLSSNKLEAAEMALASYLEQNYKLVQFTVDRRDIKLKFEDNESADKFSEFVESNETSATHDFLYVYTVRPNPKYRPVNNRYNYSETEYKTKDVIPKDDIAHVEEIRVRGLLSMYTVTITH